MVRIRRIAALAVLCVLGAAYGTATPANADTPELFDATSLGRGLELSVLGQNITLGQAQASAKSATEAVGVGVGQLLVSTSPALRAVATPTKPGPDNRAESCAVPDLIPPLNTLLKISLACGSSGASFVNGAPAANGSGRVLGIDLTADTILKSVDSSLKIGDTLATTLDPIGKALKGTPLDGTTDTVVGLVKDVLNTKTAEIALGESTASVTTSAGSVISTSTGSGAVIRLLPLPSALKAAGLPTDPVATITVGAASATARFDRGTGVATPKADAALVRIHLNDAVQLLAGVPHDIEIAPGQSFTILQGTPLESEIRVASESTATSADKSAASAEADGVLVHLLKGLNGGIKLSLAHAEAGVGGKLAIKTPVLGKVELPRQLPRTGGPSPLFPMMGVAVLIIAGATRRAIISTR